MDVYVTPKKNIILDATLAATLQGCARLYDFRFNHSLIPADGKANALEIGSVIHKVLEVFYLNQMNGFKREQCINAGLVAGEMYAIGCAICTGFIGEGKPACGHEPNEYPGVIAPPDTEGYKTGWRYALKTMEEYFDYYANDSWVPLEVEKINRKLIYEDDDIRVLWVAKLDSKVDTNSGIFPMDHKTMKQRRATNTNNLQFMGQCVVAETRTVFVNKIGLQSSLKSKDKFERVGISYSDDRLREFQSEIVPFYAYRLLEYTENQIWPPNFDHCETKWGNCEYYENVCSNDRGMREQALRVYFKQGEKWDPTNE